MRNFYTNFGFSFKGLLNFIKDLPSASSYALKR